MSSEESSEGEVDAETGTKQGDILRIRYLEWRSRRLQRLYQILDEREEDLGDVGRRRHVRREDLFEDVEIHPIRCVLVVDSGVVHEVVKASVAEDGGDVVCGCADLVEVVEVKLDDVQGPAGGTLKAAERRRLLDVTDGPHHDVVRGCEELSGELESDAAGGTEGESL